jgi:hypothetical protein
VGLHTNSHQDDMLYILQRIQATCVVCSPEFVELFERLAPSLPSLRYIIHFDKHQPSLSGAAPEPQIASKARFLQFQATYAYIDVGINVIDTLRQE